MANQKLVYHTIFILGAFLTKENSSFVISPSNSGRRYRHGYDSRYTCHWSTALCGDKFNRDIDERSRQRASSEGGGSMAAGAILGMY